MKANANLAVLRTAGQRSAPAPTWCSRANSAAPCAAGVPRERIVFSGVGKTAAEIALALRHGIRQINVETETELELLNPLAAALAASPPIAIRVNPDVDARTHAKISTGKAENKFGVAVAACRDVYAKAATPARHRASWASPCHIGSQITDLAPLEAAFAKVADLVERLRADGHALEPPRPRRRPRRSLSRTNEAPPLAPSTTAT